MPPLAAEAAAQRTLRVGIDVGGTHTYAVLLDVADGSVLASAKVLTAPDDISSSIVAAVQRLQAAAALACAGLAGVRGVSIGTTQLVNALVTRSPALARVFVVRLCGPASGALPPFSGIPPDLLHTIGGGYLLADGAAACTHAGNAAMHACRHAAGGACCCCWGAAVGGYEYDGAEICPLSPADVDTAAAAILRCGRHRRVWSARARQPGARAPVFCAAAAEAAAAGTAR